MKKKLLLFLTTLFFMSQLNAQLLDSFDKGYIILKNGSKKIGFIKNDDFKQKTSSICFKTSLDNDKCSSYDCLQLDTFGTGNETYQFFDIKLENKSVPVKLFAKKILSGGVSLYKGFYEENVFYILKTEKENFILQKDRLISGQIKLNRYNYEGLLNIATERFPKNSDYPLEFKEKVFIDVISKYNNSKGFANTVIKSKRKTKNFIIATAGAGIKNNESEFFFQLTNRIYQPKFSKSTSLNIGLNYYHFEYNLPNKIGPEIEVTQSLISVPVQLQHNFSNKKIRPYIFTGLNASYFSKKDQNNNSLIDKKGLQKNFGLGFLFGGGIEIDLLSGFMLKSEYRHETFTHLLLFGIGYNFSK